MEKSRKRLAMATVASLAALAVLGGTMAQFTDSDTAASQTLVMGELSIDIEEDPDWSHNLGSLAIGDTASRSFTLTNSGTLAATSFTLTARLQSETGPLGGNFAEAVTVSISQGSTTVVPATAMKHMAVGYPISVPGGLNPGESLPFTVHYEVVGAPAADAGSRTWGERTGSSNPDNKYQGAELSVEYSILAVQRPGEEQNGTPVTNPGDGAADPDPADFEPPGRRPNAFSSQSLGMINFGSDEALYQHPNRPMVRMASAGLGDDVGEASFQAIYLEGASLETVEITLPLHFGVLSWNTPRYTWTADGYLLIQRVEYPDRTIDTDLHLDIYSVDRSGFQLLDSHTVPDSSFMVYNPWRNELISSKHWGSTEAAPSLNLLSVANGSIEAAGNLAPEGDPWLGGETAISWHVTQPVDGGGWLLTAGAWQSPAGSTAPVSYYLSSDGSLSVYGSSSLEGPLTLGDAMRLHLDYPGQYFTIYSTAIGSMAGGTVEPDLPGSEDLPEISYSGASHYRRGDAIWGVARTYWDPAFYSSVEQVWLYHPSMSQAYPVYSDFVALVESVYETTEDFLAALNTGGGSRAQAFYKDGEWIGYGEGDFHTMLSGEDTSFYTTKTIYDSDYSILGNEVFLWTPFGD